MERINFRDNEYEVMRGLWNGLAVSTIMYELEVTKAGGKGKRRLEMLQNMAAKRRLGTNKHTTKEALRGEMEWNNLKRE